MNEDISSAVQKEIARIRNMVSTAKFMVPNANVNFAVYEVMIAEAERAVREQDATALVRLLPELQEMQ